MAGNLRINRTIHGEVENVRRINDKVLDEIVDEVGVLDKIFAARDGTERRAEAYGQVVRVHLSLVTVLGQVVQEGEEEPRHHQAGLAPLLQD